LPDLLQPRPKVPQPPPPPPRPSLPSAFFSTANSVILPAGSEKCAGVPTVAG
jgi:hypothetical protein